MFVFVTFQSGFCPNNWEQGGNDFLPNRSAWSAAVDVRSDIVMLYGIGNDFQSRAASWTGKGYNVQFMTGIAWGNYQAYFDGKFDGKRHDGDVQTDREGNPINHGPTVPYIVPSKSYLDYMKSEVKKAIDFGVTAIYLEEPEFWARGGYGETFKPSLR